jgi:HEAT repeat protein
MTDALTQWQNADVAWNLADFTWNYQPEPAADTGGASGGSGWMRNMQRLQWQLEQLREARRLADEAMEPEPEVTKKKKRKKNKRPDYSQVAAAAQLNVNYDTINQLADAIEARINDINAQIAMAKQAKKRIQDHNNTIFMLMY